MRALGIARAALRVGSVAARPNPPCRVIQERNARNTPQVTYTRGWDLSGSMEGAGGIGGLLARSSGYSSGNWTTHNYYHADGNGNITYLVNSSQTLAASYRYDPFGNLISSSGTLASANVYRFSSKELHLNSGMYYYLYRFYDPNLQRWINRDPLNEPGAESFAGVWPKAALKYAAPCEDVEGPNLYLFVRNTPANGEDSDGRGFMGRIKDKVLAPAGQIVQDNWGKLTGAVSAVCVIPKAYDACKRIESASYGWQNYYTTVSMLNAKFGDPGEWPPSILDMMNRWRNDLLRQFGSAAAACAKSAPGTFGTGPVDNPVR